MTLPGKDATPADWKAYYKAIGAPENAEGYTLPVPDGQDGAFAKEAAAQMAEVGLLPHQAKALAEWWNGKAAAAIEANKTATTKAETDRVVAADAAVKTEDAALKNEWQANYDANIEAGKRAVRQLFPADKSGAALDALQGALGYGATMRLMQKLGTGLGEGTARGLGDATGAGGQKSLEERLYPTAKT